MVGPGKAGPSCTLERPCPEGLKVKGRDFIGELGPKCVMGETCLEEE